MNVVVTGAFGYTGKFLTERLLKDDRIARVRTLTNSLQRENPFGKRVEAFPLDFSNHDAMAYAFKNCDVFVNTYWVRFTHGQLGFSFEDAVRNTIMMFHVAKQCGVKRIVHVSISNPENSELPYFKGKMDLENELKSLASDGSLSFAIVRPTVLFGHGDILVNNIAWALRSLPLFGIVGDGSYRIQPMHVSDFSQLLEKEVFGSGNLVVDGVGPETFTYKELVRLIGRQVNGKDPIIISVPAFFLYGVSMFVGWIVKDVVLTREEIRGLCDDLLYSKTTPNGSGQTKLTEWLSSEEARFLGDKYASEVGRRIERRRTYDDLMAADRSRPRLRFVIAILVLSFIVLTYFQFTS